MQILIQRKYKLANRFMKSFSTLQIIRKMQIKNICDIHNTIRMASITKTRDNKC